MRIEPLTAALGAELHDIELKQLDPDTASVLRSDRPIAATWPSLAGGGYS